MTKKGKKEGNEERGRRKRKAKGHSKVEIDGGMEEEGEEEWGCRRDVEEWKEGMRMEKMGERRYWMEQRKRKGVGG